MEFKKTLKSLPNLEGIYVYRAEFRHMDDRDRNTPIKDRLILSKDIVSDNRLYDPKKRIIQDIVKNISYYIKMPKTRFKEDKLPHDLIISFKDGVYLARLQCDTGEEDKIGSNMIQKELNK